MLMVLDFQGIGVNPPSHQLGGPLTVLRLYSPNFGKNSPLFKHHFFVDERLGDWQNLGVIKKTLLKTESSAVRPPVLHVFGSGSFYRLLGPPKTKKPRGKPKKTKKPKKPKKPKDSQECLGQGLCSEALVFLVF